METDDYYGPHMFTMLWAGKRHFENTSLICEQTRHQSNPTPKTCIFAQDGVPRGRTLLNCGQTDRFG